MTRETDAIAPGRRVEEINAILDPVRMTEPQRPLEAAAKRDEKTKA